MREGMPKTGRLYIVDEKSETNVEEFELTKMVLFIIRHSKKYEN